MDPQDILHFLMNFIKSNILYLKMISNIKLINLFLLQMNLKIIYYYCVYLIFMNKDHYSFDNFHENLTRLLNFAALKKINFYNGKYPRVIQYFNK